MLLGDSETTIRFSNRLFDEGVFATSVVFPTVALDRARIRTIVTAAHTDEMLDRSLDGVRARRPRAGRDRRVTARALGAPDPADTRPRADIEHEVWKAGVAAGLGEARDLPLDAHLHTVRSPDANAMLEAYCVLAVERGIRELAITDHVDFDPTMPAYGFASFADRERDVREAAARWADRGLAIRFGVEVTYERRYEDEIRGWLRRHPHDYVIGSVHISETSPVQGVARRRRSSRAGRWRRSWPRTSTRSSGRPGPGCSTPSATSTS